MDAFYLGDRDAPLFAIYHPPSAQRVRDAAVLLCYPIGHEQIVSHRAFTQIARRLSAAGFPVMRFDFYGCGDSAGACEDGTPARWRRDVTAAIGSLRVRSACRTIAVVGCRFGATLAAAIGAERQDLSSIVLWDPIISGAGYIDELTAIHEDMLRQTHVAGESTRGSDLELLGIALGAAAAAEIREVDLLSIARPPAARSLIVDTDGIDRSAPLRHRLISLGAAVDHQRLPVERAWAWIEDVNKVLVPNAVVSTIVSWLSEVHA